MNDRESDEAKKGFQTVASGKLDGRPRALQMGGLRRCESLSLALPFSVSVCGITLVI